MAPDYPGNVGHSLFLRSLKEISHLLSGPWKVDRAAKAAKRSSEASMTNQSSSLYVEKPKDPSQTMRALLPSAGRETKRASEFRQLVGARRDICERCEKTGHIKKNCPHLNDPAYTRCRWYKKIGHMKEAYPVKSYKNCDLIGDHWSLDCRQERQIIYTNCNVVGHKRRDCPKKKRRIAAEDRAAIGTVDLRLAPTAPPPAKEA